MVSLEILLTCFVIKMVKIIKTGSKTYEVTYNLYFYNWMTKKNYGYMGTYKIYLKKANNKNGFIITNIKQTVNKKNSL